MNYRTHGWDDESDRIDALEMLISAGAQKEDLHRLVPFPVSERDVMLADGPYSLPPRMHGRISDAGLSDTAAGIGEELGLDMRAFYALSWNPNPRCVRMGDWVAVGVPDLFSDLPRDLMGRVLREIAEGSKEGLGFPEVRVPVLGRGRAVWASRNGLRGTKAYDGCLDILEREGVLEGDLRGIMRVYVGEYPGPVGEFRCIVMRDGDPEGDLRMYAGELAEWVRGLRRGSPSPVPTHLGNDLSEVPRRLRPGQPVHAYQDYAAVLLQILELRCEPVGGEYNRDVAGPGIEGVYALPEPR